jgi:hypothetical protein
MTREKNDLLKDVARFSAPVSRRDCLRKLLYLSGALAAPFSPLPLLGQEPASTFKRQGPPLPPPTPINPQQATTSADNRYRFSPKEDSFLEEIESTTFQFFWESTDATTGLVKDRSLAKQQDARNVASIAATGFGLTAMCIAAERGWQPKDAIRARVLTNLRFVAEKLPHEHGFYYHFMKMDTGERIFTSEVSTIDTAIFLCGVLTCRSYFSDPEISALANAIYDRIDWDFFLKGGPADALTLSMGWLPESGYLKYRWDGYSELMMLYLLGMGANRNPLPAECWDSFKRPIFEFNGIRYIGAYAPLFTHQFSHAWFDFRGRHDKYADYFTNSAIATEVHKLWCLEMSNVFPDYTEDLWGISASDSQKGYTGWGGPPQIGHPDGTVVPAAPAGSLPFLPQETLRVLVNMREKYAAQAWTTYGFVDAFNPLNNWSSPDVIGIDAGITILMAENARTGFVWEHFMKNPEVHRAMEKAKFQKNT